MKFLNITNKQIWLQDLLLLFIRVWLANIFLRSGLLKIFSWDATIFLFTDEYNVPILPPDIAAIMGTSVEICAGIAILTGIFTPFAAFALLCLSIIIEIFVYPGTQEHYYWMILLLILIVFGEGRFSVTYLGKLAFANIKPLQKTN